MQRRTILGGIAALPLVAAIRPAFAQTSVTPETIASSGGDIGIHPVLHASLALSFGDQVFYIDPAENDFSTLPPPTAIFITHAHGDHYNEANLVALAGDAIPLVVNGDVYDKLPEALKARATSLENGASSEVNGIPVEAIAAYNITEDRKQYHPQGVGNGYVFTFADKKIYVAGDTEDTPEMRALTGITAAFLPMNLPYTMDIEHAAEAVKAFTPEIVYPYHYGDSDTAAFTSLVGDAAEVRLIGFYPAT